LINNGHGIASKGWKLEGQWLINDTMRLIFNAGAIDLENEAFALPCQIRDGCVTAVVGTLDPIGTLRKVGAAQPPGNPIPAFRCNSPTIVK
jgi:hypothetical protein|tara:strand:+ start:241 stop:513 length:273 start_codon:yes stop_codon:yes gene_type:complete